MTGTDLAVAHDAVAALVQATGRPYELRGRLAGGETGAHEIAGPRGEQLVLKWETDPVAQVARRRGVELTEQLRVTAGWPVPRQEVVEHLDRLFVVQELLPGAPLTALTDDLVDELLELHTRRLTIAGSPSGSVAGSGWPDELLETLISGGRGYCRHESLRAYDGRTARLVERIEAIGRSLDPADLPGADIVHWDWHPGNLLQAGGHLTAVIDNDFVTIGDAAFDLVTLAVSSWTLPIPPRTRDRLMHAAFDPLSDPQQAAYVGHLLVRCLDWPIRRHRPEEVELWLTRLAPLLPT